MNAAGASKHLGTFIKYARPRDQKTGPWGNILLLAITKAKYANPKRPTGRIGYVIDR